MQTSRQTLAGLALATSVIVAGSVPAFAQTAGTGGSSFTVASAEVIRDPQTGTVRWMIGNGQPAARASIGAKSLSYVEAATAFLQGQGASFGLAPASGTAVSATRVKSDDVGHAFVRFQQRYKGIPVIGAELNVQLDTSKNVLSVNGRSAGDLAVETDPSVSSASALKIALRAAGRAHVAPQADLVGSTPTLAVHDARILGGRPALPQLVWRVGVTSNTNPEINELVLVDAQNGRVVVEFNQTPHAVPANATQRVCDAAKKSAKVPCTANLAIANPAASAIVDVKDAFRFGEDTFDFYARRFARNSLDGKGLIAISTTRYLDPTCTPTTCPNGNFPNAFWNSSQMVYGATYASADDVVGHEFSHGFTEFESSLFYYYQSGAINESLSDIFGELIDQSNATNGRGGAVLWKMGEDLPIGAIRDMANPPLFNDPDKMTSTLWTGDFSFNDQGGVHTNSGVGNKTAYLITQPGAKAFNGRSVTGLGIDKSAAIWYYVDANLLTSSSDYADVGNALKIACRNLTGTKPRNQKGVAGAAITAADCAQVNNAILATELAKQPQFFPIPAEAPLCAAGQTATFRVNEKFEGAQTTWKFKPADVQHWFFSDQYAASNKISLLAADPSSGSKRYNTYLVQAAQLKLPAGAFLKFAQFYNLRSNDAGGVLEYSINNGTSWVRVQPALFTHNAYNGTISTSTDNPIKGSKAFTGFSGGWTSSRVNLASLANKNVKLRFRLSTSSNGAYDAWYLDDLQIFTCAKTVAAPKIALSTTPAGGFSWTNAAE